MWNILKKGNQDIIDELKQLQKELKELKEKLIKEDSKQNKFEIQFKDELEPIMNLDERKAYVSEISNIFQNYLKERLTKMINQEIKNFALGARDDKEVWHQGGIIDGMVKVFQSLEADHLEHLDDLRPKEEFDKKKVLNDLLNY